MSGFVSSIVVVTLQLSRHQLNTPESEFKSKKAKPKKYIQDQSMQVYKYTKNMDSEHFLEEWHPAQLDSQQELPFTSP